MAIDRDEVLNIIMTSTNFDEIATRVDDLDDVQIVKCNDCGSVFTSDLSDFDCIECASDNISILGTTAENLCTTKKGHWIPNENDSQTVICSECAMSIDIALTRFYRGCPYCLSDMSGGE